MLICSQGCVTQEGKPSTTWCDWLVLLAFFPLQTQKSPVNKASRLRTLETHFRGNKMMETRLRRTSSASASQLLLHLTNINSTLQRGRPPSCKCRARHKTPPKGFIKLCQQTEARLIRSQLCKGNELTDNDRFYLSCTCFWAKNQISAVKIMHHTSKLNIKLSSWTITSFHIITSSS